MSAEIERLQALFTDFNEHGAFMKLAEDGYETINLGLFCDWLVTRVEGDAFWLMHKAVGYDQGFQYTHTMKVVSWAPDDTYSLDMVDDRGRRFHVEQIFDFSEPERVETWKRWQAYRKEHAEGFAEVDAMLLDQHVEIALNWGIPLEYDEPVPEEPAPSGPVTVQYMADMKKRDDEWFFDPIGIWVWGGGLDLVIRYLPGNPDQERFVEEFWGRLPSTGLRAFPPDFMEYWQGKSDYYGNRGPIRTTDAYSSTEEAAEALLKLVEKVRDGEEVDWPGELAPRVVMDSYP